MSRILYPYENDAERLQALSNLIRLERLADIASGGGYVLHRSRWWRVTGPVGPEEVGLELAGPADPRDPQTSTILGYPDDLAVYAEEESGLQFQEGVLLDVPWPTGDLIYVADARCLGIGGDPDERVYGIFALRFEEDGSSYYYPVDSKYQPGVASSWLLYPRRDLILEWSPVDMYDLLSRLEDAHGQV